MKSSRSKPGYARLALPNRHFQDARTAFSQRQTGTFAMQEGRSWKSVSIVSATS